MTNSILIGKTIYNKIMEDEEIQSFVSGRVYPLIAEQTSSFPFIIYWRNSIQSSNYTKDGFNEDSVEFTVVVVSENYTQSLMIANRLRKILEVRKITGEDMVIADIKMVDIDESWSENSYVQTLNFTCNVN